ncbi:MAG: N-acetylmuramoyl-L-alanine amidase [Chloroflexi bacterium]|nr:N-acetylmuramoyl-L-alanine amidase [Chloroflexota bacterium]
MGRLLSKQISRRQFLAAAASTAVAGIWALHHRQAAATGRRGAVRALVHDVVHEGAAFSRGRLVGARLDRIGTAALGGPGAFESTLITSPFPFTHVGLHWKSDGPDMEGAGFEVRTSGDGAIWSPWHQVYVEARPFETPGGQTYGALVRAPRHRYLQYWASLPGSTSISSVTATFINSVDGPVIESTSSVGGTAVSNKPITFTREAWGADESLRFAGEGEIWPRSYVPTKKIVVHHTVTGNDYVDEEEAKADVRAIYTYHARTLGWSDIGYNSLVDKFGNSYEGRHGREQEDDPNGVGYGGPGGREVLSEDVVAGHALSHNYGSTGVALLGTFCSPDECAGGADPSEQMVARLKEILVWECTVHQIDPTATSDFLLSNDSWNRGLDNICGHRDCNPTICPGEQVYKLLDTLRQEVGEQLANPSAPLVLLTTFPPKDTVTPGKAQYVWEASGGAGDYLYSYYLEDWHRPANGGGLTYLEGFTEDKQPDWSDWVPDTSASFNALADGHHTFHVQAKDGKGVVSVYQDSRTRTLLTANSDPIAGDVNCDGDVNSIDGLLVLQSDAGLIDSLPCPENADVSGDGLVNALDAVLILQYDAGLIPALPP